MRQLIIGDIHFGKKSNNITFLESQIKFFNDIIIKTVETEQLDRVVFLGDVFDVRYSVNQHVGIEVKKLFRKLATIFKKDIIIIAGNHDYYSPLEELKEYNAYDLVFGDEFTKIYNNIKIVTDEPLYIDNDLFLPWYHTENKDNFELALSTHKDAKAIYCHTDITFWDEMMYNKLNHINVYSGHIHFPVITEQYNFYNLGACCAFDFNDVNQERYIYIINDYKIEKKIVNDITPKYKRVYDENIFNDDIINDKLFDNSVVQLCIYRDNINKARYIERVKELKSLYSERYSLTVKLVDKIEQEHSPEFEPIKTNISEYINSNIPQHLQEKYELIKEKLNSTTENDTQEH